MRIRMWALVSLAGFGLTGSLHAQLPPSRPLPPSLAPSAPVVPETPQDLRPIRTEAALPSAEQKFPIDPVTLSLRRLGDSWQIWAGQKLLRSFGNSEVDAREALRVMRGLKAYEWASIGVPTPLLEYGLRDGKATVVMGIGRASLPIDLRSVRAEKVKGVWVLRDAENLLLNFGTHNAEAEQAAAVVQKYGFDRIGYIGTGTPVMAYLFVAPQGEQPLKLGFGELGRQVQIEALARTGIPIPGLGFVGEMVRIDFRKVEVRRDGHEWVLAHGPDVLGRFGAGEWQARDALRVVQDGHFTDWCKFGTPGVTFFLASGKAPTRASFASVARQFGESELQVRQFNNKWWVLASSRPLFEVASAAEGEDLIRLLKHFGFNQICQTGNSPRASMTFLAKAR